MTLSHKTTAFYTEQCTSLLLFQLSSDLTKHSKDILNWGLLGLLFCHSHAHKIVT